MYAATLRMRAVHSIMSDDSSLRALASGMAREAPDRYAICTSCG
jgi:hypothetical protein